MKFCKNCGKQLDDVAKFCDECGTAVSKSEVSSDSALVDTNLPIPYVIPEQFTDEYWEDQKIALETKIESLETEIEQLKEQIQDAGDKMKDCKDEIRNNLRPQLSEAQEQVLIGRHNAEVNREIFSGPNLRHTKNWQRTVDNIINAMAQKEQEAESWHRYIEAARQSIETNRNDRTNAKAMLRDAESILKKTPVQRMEKHYQMLVNKKTSTSCIYELSELSEQFREMEGYKDTEELAYDVLIQAKNKATGEEDFLYLVEQFKEMNGYKDAKKLVSECENSALKVRYDTLTKAKKVRYDTLVKAKNEATSEKDFMELAEHFRAMNGFENAEELATECENHSQMLREKAYSEAVIELQELNEGFQQFEATGKSSASEYEEAEEGYDALFEKFDTFGEYKEAANLAEQCKSKRDDCKQKKYKIKQKRGCIFLTVIAIIIVTMIVGLVVA